MNPHARDGLPAHLAPRTRRIFFEALDVPVDIGFHDFEIGTPQRLLVDVDIRVEEASFPTSDLVADAWNYDFVRTEILRIAASDRFNLQETFAHAVYGFVARLEGVTGLRVATRKPDVYPDCDAVGVEMASF